LFESVPKAFWNVSPWILFQPNRTSLNIDGFKARDQPRTALWPVMSMSLLKSPETTGPRTGGSLRLLL
jgi:hypothetical protein